MFGNSSHIVYVINNLCRNDRNVTIKHGQNLSGEKGIRLGHLVSPLYYKFMNVFSYNNISYLLILFTNKMKIFSVENI